MAAGMRMLCLGLALSCVMPGCDPPSPGPTGAADDAANAVVAVASAADASNAEPVEAAASTTGSAADGTATAEPDGSSATPAKAAKVKGSGSKTGSKPEEPAASTVSKKPGPTKVARIVFVGKENACECTRKRIDAGWDALQKALGTPPKLPVVRLQIDTQSSKVDPYREQQAMVALPAIYFVDAQGVVLELLQGDITKAQVVDALKKL